LPSRATAPAGNGSPERSSLGAGSVFFGGASCAELTTPKNAIRTMDATRRNMTVSSSRADVEKRCCLQYAARVEESRETSAIQRAPPLGKKSRAVHLRRRAWPTHD